MCGELPDRLGGSGRGCRVASVAIAAVASMRAIFFRGAEKHGQKAEESVRCLTPLGDSVCTPERETEKLEIGRTQRAKG